MHGPSLVNLPADSAGGVCVEEHRAKNRTDQTTGPFITDPSDYIYEIQLL